MRDVLWDKVVEITSIGEWEVYSLMRPTRTRSRRGYFSPQVENELAGPPRRGTLHDTLLELQMRTKHDTDYIVTSAIALATAAS